LDIDVISNDVLWRIYDLVMKYAPEVEAGLRQSLMEQRESPRVARSAPKKKNKPMTKSEQERKLEQIKGTLDTFKKANSQSQEPVMPSKHSSCS
jgi:bromodomain-containing factor 1